MVTGTASTLYHNVTDPIGSFKRNLNAVIHPINTVNAIANQISAQAQTLEGQGELSFNAALIILTFGDAAASSLRGVEAAEGATTAANVEKLEDIANAANKSEQAGNAANLGNPANPTGQVPGEGGLPETPPTERPAGQTCGPDGPCFVAGTLVAVPGGATRVDQSALIAGSDNGHSRLLEVGLAVVGAGVLAANVADIRKKRKCHRAD